MDQLKTIIAASALFAASGLQAGTAPAAATELHTNEAYLEALAQSSRLDLDDPLAVFAFVFDRLPEQVKVYPTENYYYFKFIENGQHYAGNLRFDVVDRDQGFVHFAYYHDYTEWRRGDDPQYRKLGSADGVVLEKRDELVYAARYGGKSVVFRLNDLSEVRPPEGLLHANERYLGPIFDEAGIQFYLVFNPDLKVFHYILNDSDGAGDKLYASEAAERIEIGSRSGFAFYRDHHLDRRILIGVHKSNSNVNNYYDGPFDQLPDNFIDGDALKEAILAVEPEMAGTIDRFGNSPGGDERYFIGPYIYWAEESELVVFDDCATNEDIGREFYYACFSVLPDDLEDDGPDEEPETADHNGAGDGGK